MEDLADLFRESLAEVPRAEGVNNHMGSKFTRDERAMSLLADQLIDHRLFFIDSYTVPDSRAMAAVASKDVPTARSNLFIDTVQDKQVICSRLSDLAALAHRQRVAIAIGHPYEATVEALQDCAPAILEGIDLVGAGQLVQIQNGESK